MRIRWSTSSCTVSSLNPNERKAPPDDPKQLSFLVYGTFAATEDDFENDRGCKGMLKVVKYKELYDNLGDEDRSTLHKYAREKSESRAFASR